MPYYILNAKGEVSGKCDGVPDIEDLASRGASCIKSEEDLYLGNIEWVDGKFKTKPIIQKDVEIKETLHHHDHKHPHPYPDEGGMINV